MIITVQGTALNWADVAAVLPGVRSHVIVVAAAEGELLGVALAESEGDELGLELGESEAVPVPYDGDELPEELGLLLGEVEAVC